MCKTSRTSGMRAQDHGCNRNVPDVNSCFPLFHIGEEVEIEEER